MGALIAGKENNAAPARATTESLKPILIKFMFFSLRWSDALNAMVNGPASCENRDRTPFA
jgi:hypothetical protein